MYISTQKAHQESGLSYTQLGVKCLENSELSVVITEATCLSNLFVYLIH